MNSGGGSEIVLSHHDALSTSGLGNVTFNRGSAQLGSIGSACDGATDSGNLKFWTTSSGGSLTERMRITSNGELLVGKTASDNSTVGTRFQSDGFASLVRDGDASLLLRRNTSDGNILRFNKAGTDVGSIGVAASDNLYIAGSTGSTKGLYFNDAGILPATTGGSTLDNAVDLGQANVRFKNLYLSGGVVLDDNPTAVGGSVTSKTLDDYEEGTFTPTVASTGTNPTVTYSMQEGNYTKIGRQVTITAEIRFSAYTDNGGSFRLEGIPFSVFGDTNYRAVGSVALAEMAVNLTGDYSVLQLAWNSGNSMQVIQNNSVTSGDAETPTSKIDAGTRIRYQITYFTT